MPTVTPYGGAVKPIRPHNYLQTMVRPRSRRIQIVQIVLALAVLAALFLTRPQVSQTARIFGGTVQPASLQFNAGFWTTY